MLACAFGKKPLATPEISCWRSWMAEVTNVPKFETNIAESLARHSPISYSAGSRFTPGGLQTRELNSIPTEQFGYLYSLSTAEDIPMLGLRPETLGGNILVKAKRNEWTWGIKMDDESIKRLPPQSVVLCLEADC